MLIFEFLEMYTPIFRIHTYSRSSEFKNGIRCIKYLFVRPFNPFQFEIMQRLSCGREQDNQPLPEAVYKNWIFEFTVVHKQPLIAMA